jgi:hypothetical protein
MAARERNPDEVRRLLAAAGQRRPLGRRQAGETLREVFRLDRGYVLKRYTLPLDVRRYRRPWLREHDALERLDGWHVPRTVGYVEDIDGERRVVCYVRSYVSARPVVAVDVAALRDMATVLAGFHRRAVVTDDALLQNFMRARDGRLVFVDMGRARLFRPHSPLLALGIALELTKFRRASLRGDDALFRAFTEAYFEASHLRRTGRTIVRLLMRLLIWQRGVRDRQRY